jgi:hypothetical protein
MILSGLGELLCQSSIESGRSRISCGVAWGIILNAVTAYYLWIAPFWSSLYNGCIAMIVMIIVYSLFRCMTIIPQHLINKGSDGKNALVQKILQAPPIYNGKGDEGKII